MRGVLLALVRIAVGASFVLAGAAKLRDHAKEAALFAHWGLPAPGTAVSITAGVEIACGLLVLTGLATRLGALVLGVEMLGAIATAGRIDHGFHLVAPPILAACCLLLVARGGGRWLLVDVLDPTEPPRQT